MRSAEGGSAAWALLALQRKLEWDLEAARARIGKESRALHEAMHRLAGLQHASADLAAHARHAFSAAADPAAHARLLQGIAAAASREAEAATSVQQLEHRVAIQRTASLQAQARLESLLALRCEQERQLARSLRHRAASEADRAWLARPPAPGAQPQEVHR